MMRPIFRPGDGWELCRCVVCDRLHYVEPHAMTALCPCSTEWTEHRPIPDGERVRTVGGDHYRDRRGR